MSDYIEDEGSNPEEQPESGVRRKRVRRKRKRSGVPTPLPVGRAAKERRSGDKRVKKEAIARLDLSGKEKLNPAQVMWVIISGTVLFFGVGIITLDLIFNRDSTDEDVADGTRRAQPVPWAESAGVVSGEDQVKAPDRSGGIPTIADFEAATAEAPAGAEAAAATAQTLELPPPEEAIDARRDQLIAQAYASKLYDQAIELALEELDRNPSSGTVRHRLALAYRDSGQPDKAMAMFQEQLKRSEGNGARLLCLIELAKLAEVGQGETSPLDYFDRAMEIDSGHPAVLKEFGLYLRRQQRHQEGYYQTRREMARIVPDDQDLARMKFAALQARHFEPFEEAHARALKAGEPNGYDCMVEAGRLLHAESREEAVEWTRRARLQFGDNHAAFHALVRDPLFTPLRAEFIGDDKPVAAVPLQAAVSAGAGPEVEAAPAAEPGKPVKPAKPAKPGGFELEMPDDLTPLN